MKRGHSGATITECHNGVMKMQDRGKGLLEQAAHCELLAPITPKVIAKFETDSTESYKMELLYEPDLYAHQATAWAVESLRRIRCLLAANVWGRRVEQTQSNAWRESLAYWLSNYPELRERLSDLLGKLALHGEYGLIHGDPTLANVLYRESGDLVICDPIPPGGKIPSHYTVDLGKMLQSAIGWETEMFGWRYNTVATVNTVLRSYSDKVKMAAWFWASIHCLRIMPYAIDRRTEVWALEKARLCVDQCRSYTCSTHSISTVR